MIILLILITFPLDDVWILLEKVDVDYSLFVLRKYRYNSPVWCLHLAGLKLLAFTCCLRDVDGDAACDDYNDDDANNYHDCDVKTGQFRARLLALTLEKLGSFSIDDGDSSENVTFKMN